MLGLKPNCLNVYENNKHAVKIQGVTSRTKERYGTLPPFLIPPCEPIGDAEDQNLFPHGYIHK